MARILRIVQLDASYGLLKVELLRTVILLARDHRAHVSDRIIGLLSSRGGVGDAVINVSGGVDPHEVFYDDSSLLKLLSLVLTFIIPKARSKAVFATGSLFLSI